MKPVYIAGAALRSARGTDLAEAVAQVRAGTTAHAIRTIPTLDGERAVPYFAMPVADDGNAAIADVGRAAFIDAGVSTAAARQAALIVGSSSLQIAAAEANPDGRLHGGMSEVARHVKAALGLVGLDYTINTACTSSAHALLAAHALLSAGACATALVFGIERFNLTTVAGFHAMQLLGGAARPFDRARDGLVLGEAIAAIVLTTQARANAPRLLGGANRIDTSNAAGTDPSGAAIEAVMRCALVCTETLPGHVALLKAQAAGSPMQDRAEARACAQLFGETPPPVTSLKGYLGHALGASGCAELALLLGCWRAGFTPATAGCVTPEADLSLHPLREHAAVVPRYALLNHTGFGGGQAALVIETGV